MKILVSFCLLLSVLLVACGDTAEPILPAADNDINVGNAVAQPSPAPTQASVQTANCVPAANPSPPAKPAVFSETATSLLGYLNVGASIENATAALQTWGNVFADPQTKQLLGGAKPARFFADGVQIVFTYFDPTQTDPQNPLSRFGDVLALACVNGQYQIAYQALTDPVFLGIVLSPRFFSDEDVTGDGVGDLSFLTGDCGENGGNCVDALTVVSAVGAQPSRLQNILPEVDLITLPYPVFKFVASANSPAKDIYATAGFASGAGSGPQRVVTDIWSFNGSTFAKASEFAEPPVYRIHALHDADAAFRRRDYQTADALYLRVATDPSLQAWDSAGANESALLTAFAYVRMVQTNAVRGDTVGAQAALDSLKTFAAQNPSAQIYLGMAQAFWEGYAAGNVYAQGCQNALAYAAQTPAVFTQLGTGTYAFNNAEYEAVDMCVL